MKKSNSTTESPRLLAARERAEKAREAREAAEQAEQAALAAVARAEQNITDLTATINSIQANPTEYPGAGKALGKAFEDKRSALTAKAEAQEAVKRTFSDRVAAVAEDATARADLEQAERQAREMAQNISPKTRETINAIDQLGKKNLSPENQRHSTQALGSLLSRGIRSDFSPNPTFGRPGIQMAPDTTRQRRFPPVSAPLPSLPQVSKPSSRFFDDSTPAEPSQEANQPAPAADSFADLKEQIRKLMVKPASEAALQTLFDHLVNDQIALGIRKQQITDFVNNPNLINNKISKGIVERKLNKMLTEMAASHDTTSSLKMGS